MYYKPFLKKTFEELKADEIDILNMV